MPEEQFQKVANKDDLKEGAMLKVEVNGKQIVLSMEKYMLLMRSAPMREDHYMKVSLMDTTLNVHGIMQYLMLEMEKFQMQQSRQQTLILIL